MPQVIHHRQMVHWQTFRVELKTLCGEGGLLKSFQTQLDSSHAQAKPQLQQQLGTFPAKGGFL
jgi:hypothetical protein